MRLLAVFYVAAAGLAVAALGLVGIASLVRVRFSFGIASRSCARVLRAVVRGRPIVTP